MVELKVRRDGNYTELPGQFRISVDVDFLDDHALRSQPLQPRFVGFARCTPSRRERPNRGGGRFRSPRRRLVRAAAKRNQHQKQQALT